MVVRNFRKKALAAGAVLILSGLIIAFAALSAGGWQTLNQAEKRPWYQTVWIESGKFTFSLDFYNGSLFHIAF